MKIAIIGAGLAGLSTAYHLYQQNTSIELHIFDHLQVGGQASGIAAGLLHPFSGLHAKLNRYGHEGFFESCQLLETVAASTNQKIFESNGLLRLAITKAQEKDYEISASLNKEVTYLNSDECQNLAPIINPFNGIFIKSAKTVYTLPYLNALFAICKKNGATFHKKEVTNLKDLSSFDKIIVTRGASTNSFTELQHLPISFIKGQILELEWPEHLPFLQLSLNSKCYVVMNPNKKSCIVGATFERFFSTPFPDLKIAEAEIMPKVIQLIPGLENAKIINCKAAIRVSTKDHLPITAQINKKLFAFTGLGSKGLLYHAFYGKKIAQMAMDG